jgi:hypothetical protein
VRHRPARRRVLGLQSSAALAPRRSPASSCSRAPVSVADPRLPASRRSRSCRHPAAGRRRRRNAGVPPVRRCAARPGVPTSHPSPSPHAVVPNARPVTRTSAARLHLCTEHQDFSLKRSSRTATIRPAVAAKKGRMRRTAGLRQAGGRRPRSRARARRPEQPPSEAPVERRVARTAARSAAQRARAGSTAGRRHAEAPRRPEDGSRGTRSSSRGGARARAEERAAAGGPAGRRVLGERPERGCAVRTIPGRGHRARRSSQAPAGRRRTAGRREAHRPVRLRRGRAAARPRGLERQRAAPYSSARRGQAGAAAPVKPERAGAPHRTTHDPGGGVRNRSTGWRPARAGGRSAGLRRPRAGRRGVGSNFRRRPSVRASPSQVAPLGAHGDSPPLPARQRQQDRRRAEDLEGRRAAGRARCSDSAGSTARPLVRRAFVEQPRAPRSWGPHHDHGARTSSNRSSGR